MAGCKRDMSKPDDIAVVHTASRLENLCREYGVASLSITRTDELVTALANTRATLALSCCYPWRLPADFLSERFERSLNIHPSRLPAWRGPDPVFWQLRAGLSRIPVTVHEIASRIDRGQPVANGEVDSDRCATESDLDIAISRLGVELALSSAGRLPLLPLKVESGVESRGLWHRSPTPGDYRVFPTWTVVHAARFMRLMGERHIPFRWSPPGSHAIEFHQSGRWRHSCIDEKFSRSDRLNRTSSPIQRLHLGSRPHSRFPD